MQFNYRGATVPSQHFSDGAVIVIRTACDFQSHRNYKTAASLIWEFNLEVYGESSQNSYPAYSPAIGLISLRLVPGCAAWLKAAARPHIPEDKDLLFSRVSGTRARGGRPSRAWLRQRSLSFTAGAPTQAMRGMVPYPPQPQQDD